VPDPAAAAEWYTRHLGMRVLRRVPGATQTHFVADGAGRVVLELYRQTKAPVPDYFAMDPMVLHIAFVVKDVAAERQRLLAAGAHGVNEVAVTDSGDQLAMLRDPWGVAIQLVTRSTPLQ